MKKLNILLSMVIIILLTGCGKKDIIVTDKFKDTMQTEGFEVYDSETAGVSLGASYGLSTSNGLVSYKFELYEFENSSVAKDMFTVQYNRFKDLYEGKNSIKHKSNYSVAYVDSKEKYIMLYRVDEKIIFAYGTDKDKELIEEMMHKLGY